MRAPRSLRARLLVLVVASVVAALAIMTVVFNILLWNGLADVADDAGRARVQAEIALHFSHGRIVPRPDLPNSLPLEGTSWVFGNGRIIEHPHTSAPIEAAVRALAANGGSSAGVPESNTRLYAASVGHGGRQVGRVVVAISLAPYEATRRVALLASLGLASIILVVVALVARWTLAAALGPVARMTADAAAWGEHDLKRRFARGQPYDEITELAATLDGLLDRIAASLRREQQFTAELSHELRTPLARICAEAELTLRRQRNRAEYREALTTVLRNARQLSSAVDTLMVAAQQESGLAHGRANAHEVMEECSEACEHLAEDSQVTIDVDPRPAKPVYVGVDGDVAMRVLQPLLENACRYARSQVRLSLGREGADVMITVTDDGPGVGAEEAERIFTPGVRGSAAATAPADSQGAGLGLSLARRLAEAASGGVVAVPDATGGHFVVRLPSG